MEDRRTVRWGKNSLMHIDADFPLVDIECRNNFDVSRPIPSYFPMHQADSLLRVFVLVIVDTLY